MTDEYDDLGLSDEELDELLEAMAEADRHAATVLREALGKILDETPPEPALAPAAAALRRGVDDGRWPYDYFVGGCGWTSRVPQGDDETVWLEAAAATIYPPGDPGTDVEEQAALGSLHHADWLALVAGLVRRGVGARFDGDHALTDLEEMPEIEGESSDPDDDRATLDHATVLLAPLWRALGALDRDDRLTPLGRWGLPRALELAWTTTDDTEPALDAPAVAEPLDERSSGLMVELLREGPADLATLRRRLAQRSVFLDEDRLYAALELEWDTFDLPDGRWVHLPTIADGIVSTHRVTEEELALDALAGTPDLVLIDYLADDGLPFAGGGELRTAYSHAGKAIPAGETSAITGPEGWLAHLAPGQLVGLRYAGGGIALELVTEDQLAVDAAPLLDSIASTVDEHVQQEGEPGMMLIEPLIAYVADRPGALKEPLPPLSELLDGTDLEVHGSFVGAPGTAWDGEPEWLDDDERTTYRGWRRSLDDFRRTGEVPPSDELVALVEALRAGDLDLAATQVDDRVLPLVEAMRDAVGPPSAAIPLYLLSRIAEEEGDGEQWLRHLEAALAADPELKEAAGDLGDLRSVAGNAADALGLWRSADVDPAAPDVQLVGRFLRPPEGQTGRNKPCPCGSGKKYKVCHGKVAEHPLEARAPWLWAKILTFAQRGTNRVELMEWADLTAGDDADDRTVVALAMGHPLVHDFAIFDGGLLDDFLETLGFLLPADERALAEQWSVAPRRLLEVHRVRAWQGIETRDLVTGESITVLDRTMSQELAVKDILLARPLPDGAGALRLQLDPVQLPRQHRSRLLDVLRRDSSGEAVAEFFAGLSRPPTLTTTEGEELVMCTARYDVPDLDDAWQRLAELFGEGSEGELVAEGPARGEGAVVRGRLFGSGGRLVVETNAVERLRRIQDQLLGAVPEARLVDESTRPFAEAAGEHGGGGSASAPVELTDELRRQIVRQHEDSWLEDHIPALGGLTPREAAQDPDARKELAALLDDFEWADRRADGALTMDVARLRRELGLSS